MRFLWCILWFSSLDQQKWILVSPTFPEVHISIMNRGGTEKRDRVVAGLSRTFYNAEGPTEGPTRPLCVKKQELLALIDSTLQLYCLSINLKVN